ncbi:abortive infection protein [Clostridium folliculivorans]|uniref:Abortive infection protein n=1 Tax=Clostridium folliculivorans TaxID=2886038 RepID=A0A9W6DCN5_9CLOT|nr:abortive infection protein [Clostridium folliculivorans]GKU27509.1 hypothetical protein CFOLD11_43360 [Clostridium folliculivorans]GKU32359.1 hypothetical protein CFB3_44670 [Clostridium folliculivorans]
MNNTEIEQEKSNEIISSHKSLRYKGINYDVGTFTRGKSGPSSRDIFNPAQVKKEMRIIKNDLHCNSIRISGMDIERLTLASEYALMEGLEVWFSPANVDADENETIDYFIECAKAAEKLRNEYNNIVFVTGCELTFFMKGLVLGETAFDRINTFMKPWTLLKSTILKGPFNKRLNNFLHIAVKTIRDNFHGEITYASGPWEDVNWSIFDNIGIDYYRDAMNKNRYRENLKKYFKHNKPVIITEFGCCTYRGAEDKGSYGWAIVDTTKTPKQLKGEFIRDENVQVRYITESLDIFTDEKIDGAFVFTFINQSYPYNENPLYDLDMAAYGIVKSYIDQMEKFYEGMPWEPKASFKALAEYYKTI